jgi:anti-sigma-K factor RskA
MSDDRMSQLGHEPWDELAAGYALSALEPEEQARFEAHVATCARCRQHVAEGEQTAAELARLAGPVEPPAELWQRIRAQLPTAPVAVPVESPEKPAPPAPVPLPAQSNRARWWQSPRVLAAAAVLAAVVVGVGAWQGTARLGGGGTTRAQALVSGCRHDPTCRVVDLDQQHVRRAVLLVRARRAELVPTGLSDLPADRSYVLWQLPSSGAPQGVAVFRAGADQQPVPATLPLPLEQTTAFAISQEPGHTIPAKPSHVVAVGAATD